MHLWLSLPTRIETGAVRKDDWDADVQTTDDGGDVRNTRWATPLSEFDVALPVRSADDPDFVAVRAMWKNARGSADTFNFTDWIDGTRFRVRFDEGLQFTTPKRMPKHHIDTFTLKQSRDDSPEPSVVPAITGTAAVGEVLSVDTGTWTGAPVSYAYQWQADGAGIAGATGAAYTVQAGDIGKTIGCAVTATDADGGATRVWAGEIGPIL